MLHEKGLDESLAARFATALSAFKEDLKKRPIGPRGQATLDKLMPRMIELICGYPDPVELLNRITGEPGRRLFKRSIVPLAAPNCSWHWLGYYGIDADDAKSRSAFLASVPAELRHITSG